MKKQLLALIFLAVGIFTMLQGSSLSSNPAWIDYVFIVVGAALTVSYLPLMGRYLEQRYKAKETLTYMPILATLGAVLIYQAVFRALFILDKSILAVVGAVLLLGSGMYIRRKIKAAGRRPSKLPSKSAP